jgi:hypothetical protein
VQQERKVVVDRKLAAAVLKWAEFARRDGANINQVIDSLHRWLKAKLDPMISANQARWVLFGDGYSLLDNREIGRHLAALVSKFNPQAMQTEVVDLRRKGNGSLKPKGFRAQADRWMKHYNMRILYNQKNMPCERCGRSRMLFRCEDDKKLRDWCYSCWATAGKTKDPPPVKEGFGDYPNGHSATANRCRLCGKDIDSGQKICAGCSHTVDAMHHGTYGQSPRLHRRTQAKKKKKQQEGAYHGYGSAETKYPPASPWETPGGGTDPNARPKRRKKRRKAFKKAVEEGGSLEEITGAGGAGAFERPLGRFKPAKVGSRKGRKRRRFKGNTPPGFRSFRSQRRTNPFKVMKRRKYRPKVAFGDEEGRHKRRKAR